MTDLPSMHGKRCVITGATSGIGEATALALASAGAELSLVCRSPERAEETLARIHQAVPEAAVDLVFADLSAQAQVRHAAQQILADPRPIHVLLNNAGVVQLSRTTTVDGIETTFAVNHLAYFLLTMLLLERIRETPAARIVNVASEGHRFSRMDFDDLGHEKRFRWMQVYGQSKLANILFTRELARRLEGSGVTVNSLHPGGVSTQLGANNATRLHGFVMALAKPFMKTPEQGARTSIYLATSTEVADVTGEYFANCKRKRGSRESEDADIADRLWQVSEELTGWAG
ncbi:MAG: SDR family oxidoreductase [Myxococcota bacterium]|nr:SDR family oxidoreductase [Myxococcota bacterium]